MNRVRSSDYRNDQAMPLHGTKKKHAAHRRVLVSDSRRIFAGNKRIVVLLTETVGNVERQKLGIAVID